jgi:predicted nucleic acid-binding protein
MMDESVFIDTWGWLALGHRKDSGHQQIKTFYRRLQDTGARLYTSDYVLDEVTAIPAKIVIACS